MKRVKHQPAQHTVLLNDYEITQMKAGLKLLKAAIIESLENCEMPHVLHELADTDEDDVQLFLAEVEQL